jgi:hypothetical protein
MEKARPGICNTLWWADDGSRGEVVWASIFLKISIGSGIKIGRAF